MEEKNEFKELVDAIKDKYSLTQFDLSDKLDISILAFSRFYTGIRKVNHELIEKLNSLYNINEEELNDIRKKQEEKEQFNEFAVKLSKLNKEHQETVYNLIALFSLYEEEDNNKVKKLSNEERRD